MISRAARVSRVARSGALSGVLRATVSQMRIGTPGAMPAAATPSHILRWASSAPTSNQPPPEAVELTDIDLARLRKQRNIGISAHIDSGKTTLTERVLYYTGRVKDIHEVRGRDGVGAKMDHMELEREKGITIQSAATFCDWEATPPALERSLTGEKDGMGEGGEKERYAINIIDTPGHVDFTIEVERALRVLDGAVLVLCAVSGVQSQTITVDRQMKRYNVPRVCFINKMDRAGANPWRVIDQIRQKLRLNAAAVQVPIGAEDNLRGVVDLVRWKAIYNHGYKGVDVVETDEIPADLKQFAEQKRQELVEQICDADEVLGDKLIMEEPISNHDLAAGIRRAAITRKFTPVYVGSAFKNVGVQPVLDGVCAYLPDPSEVAVEATDTKLPVNSPPVQVIPASDVALVGLAFKLEEGRFGQLTYMRVYQGVLKRGGVIFNARTGKKVKVPRLVRMHSNDMEDVDSIGAGEICAMFGVECSSGDTFTDGTTSYTMTNMFVPDPVVSLSIKPSGQETPNFSKALNRFQKEDPTFRVHVDSESQETIISGMGELHLDIYVERMRREYRVDCQVGKPQVAFRETITQSSEFAYTHKKQSGGAGQFGKMIGRLEPMSVDENGKDVGFENRVTGGNIPNNYMPSIEKGFHDALAKGALSGHNTTGVKMIVEDGAHHPVDSSEMAFRITSAGAFRDAFHKASPVILEPIMKVEIVAPIEFQGSVIGGINQRRGTIIDTEIRDEEFTLICEVALNDMFGYSSNIRGLTQGKGEFSMEYKDHQPVLPNIQMKMVEEYRKKQAEKK
ncbi:hypothetical protein E3P91_00055 [Wallemia ichthyophaga]|nr:hypothetical protein E3P91_00055 [Wallemia ichthyophaga]TIB65772.1 hypothetical protein E3P78_00370 [Wallemia ichthyophaga]